MLIDTHCHLDAAEFAFDREHVVGDALRAGVDRILVPGVEAANFPTLAQCCLAHPLCRPAYGIHPLYVDRAGEDDLTDLRQWLTRGDALAVGEIGLDQFLADTDLDRQLFYFREQLKIARDFDLPVILHVRRAIDPILRELRRTKVRGGIAHAFNGSRQQADEFLKLGFKLGFGGALTYPGSTRIRALASDLPLTAIVLETDAPDIPPVWLNRGRNTPGELARIAEVLAELRGLPVEEIKRATTAAALAVMPGLT